MKLFSLIFFLSFLFFQSSHAQKISQLKFINQYEIPFNAKFKNTSIGGLSGIDYDAKKDLYYMICDDRGDINPLRFYTAKIHFTTKIDSVEFVEVTTLLNKDGKPHPNKKQDKFHVPDPEALRLNVATNQLIWSSEGDRRVAKNDTVLENPAVTIISKNGKYIDTFSLPKNVLMQATEKGPRLNGVFEGLSFADDYKTLFVSIEEPLYEDGPRADVATNNAFVRILKFDIATKKCMAQYAYKLEPVAHEAFPATAFKVNGIVDVLHIGNNKILVMERSFSMPSPACTIKLFETDLSKASDITNNQAMIADKNFTAVTKKLLLNFDDLGIYVDNVEGMTFGPDLPNGHKTLLFVTDNNFSIIAKTQFFLFEVIP
jgi:hypothetical protein